MSGGANGSVSLSAIDFLGLAKQRKVARLDLGELGYEGIIYVRELTAAEQARVTATSGRAGRARFYKDRSYEMDLAALTEASGPKFLEAAVVTDGQEAALLERAFAAAGPDAVWVMMPATELVQMAEVWVREAGNRDKMYKTLEALPNAVTNAVVKLVRELSGMGEEEVDQVEAKKESF